MEASGRVPRPCSCSNIAGNVLAVPPAGRPGWPPSRSCARMWHELRSRGRRLAPHAPPAPRSELRYGSRSDGSSAGRGNRVVVHAENFHCGHRLIGVPTPVRSSHIQRFGERVCGRLRCGNRQQLWIAVGIVGWSIGRCSQIVDHDRVVGDDCRILPIAKDLAGVLPPPLSEPSSCALRRQFGRSQPFFRGLYWPPSHFVPPGFQGFARCDATYQDVSGRHPTRSGRFRTLKP